MSHYNIFMNNKHQGFFDLSLDEQEKLKAANPIWATEYETFLYRNVCKISSGTLDEMDRMSIEKNVELEFNKHKLYYHGVGVNNFQIITPLMGGTTTRSFNTLFDYDSTWFEATAEATRKYTGKEPEAYRPQLLDVYCRAQMGEEKEFRYLFLRSAAAKIGAVLEDESVKLLETLIPHEYVSSVPDDSEIETVEEEGVNYNLLSYELDANGQEGVLLELKERTTRYIVNMESHYSKKFEKENINIIWTEEFEDKYGDEIFYYFSTPVTLKQAELRNWEASIADIVEDDVTLLNNMQDLEIAKLSAFIQMEYEDIIENYTPELEKKHNKKVTMAITDDHLDLLSEALEEDEEEKEKALFEKEQKELENKKAQFTVIKKDD